MIKKNGLHHIDLINLPTELHNRPERIPQAVRTAIQAGRGRFEQIVVAYADCGTGGKLDDVLREEGVERLPGSHCYDFFAGVEVLEQIADEEPGSFYLTDFLVRHFDRLVIRGLGIARYPDLLPTYFANYRRVVYLAQEDNPELQARARLAAQRLGLSFEQRSTGYSRLESGFLPLVRMPRPQHLSAPQAAHG